MKWLYKKYIKTRVYVLLTGLILSMPAFSQLSEGGIPPGLQSSKLKNMSVSETYKLPEINITKLEKQDKEFPTPLRYSVIDDVNINLKENGVLYSAGDSGTIWQYRIISDQALSISLTFSNYHLPPGAKLFVYNSSKELIFGAYTNKNNKKDNTFTISDFPDNNLIIEYYEPKNPIFSGKVQLAGIGQAYRDIYSLDNKDLQDDNIDINCPAGDPFQLEKHAVAKMTFHDAQYGYLCTGALINTTGSDGTPYFLTANHCIGTDTIASTLITYFNYEKVDCNGNTHPGVSLSGATLKATDLPSDFTLLLLDEIPPASYKPYFAGWNAQADSVVKWGYGIHHPAGKVKKIAIAHNQIVSIPYPLSWENSTNTPANTHWGLQFDTGFTEGGSSGSPLFDNNNKIIGQLHGGSDPDDFFGKLSYSWDKNTAAEHQLKAWLDPKHSGTKIMEGYAPSNNDPEAFFYTDFQQVCAGQPVTIRNGSLFGPTGFKWTFDPSTVTYYNNTSATSENPVVSFDSTGLYTITLEVTKGSKTDIRKRVNYINADTTIDVRIDSYLGKIITFTNFGSFYLVAKGAEEYSWQLSGDELLDKLYSVNNDTLFISLKKSAQIDRNFTFRAVLTGTQGTCSDSDSVSFEILYPFNDNVENAYLLKLGSNGPFTNQGAGVQPYEPVPPDPYDGCNTQHTWCQCNISDTILDNSVWFYFTGPATGIAGINASGFDDQIAVYKANSWQDILSGDTSRFSLLAANDDYFGQDSSYSALIEGVQVISGEKYWVQVDGSACGTYGIFYIDLADHRIGNNPSSIDNQHEVNGNMNLTAFPNPAEGTVNIKIPIALKNAELSVVNLTGKTIKSKKIEKTNADEIIRMDLNTIPAGLYLIKITTASQTLTTRFIIK